MFLYVLSVGVLFVHVWSLFWLDMMLSTTLKSTSASSSCYIDVVTSIVVRQIVTIIISVIMFILLSLWQGHCESSLSSLMNVGWVPTLRDQANRLRLWVYLYYSAQRLIRWYSFYRPTEGRRLSRPRRWLHTEMVYPLADGHPSNY